MKFFAFLKEAWEELKRTHYPSRKELVGFTIVVLVTLGIVAIYVGSLGIIIRWLTSFAYPEHPSA